MIFAVCFLILALMPQRVRAQEEDLSSYDFSQIEKELRAGTDSEQISFMGLVKELMKGNAEGFVKGLGKIIGDNLIGELRANQRVLMQLILVAVVAAVFTNFAAAFANAYIGEAGFFVTYLTIFAMLTTSFLLAVQVAKDVVVHILSFMKALIPAYSMAITVTSGVTSAAAVYEVLMLAITIADCLVLYVIIPGIQMYLLLSLVNLMEKEDLFSRFAGLIKGAVNWLMKTIMAVIIGFQVIQGLLAPAIDSVKNTALQKSIQAIPGAGGATAAVMSTILGSGVIIKNSIGIAGLIGILFVVCVPMIKLLVFVIGYKFTAALLQPISDKRIVSCIHFTGQAAKMLFDAVICIAALFMISLALAAAATNVRYYAG